MAISGSSEDCLMPKPSQPGADLLRHVPYFAGLAPNILAALAEASVARRFDRGQLIFLEGEACAGLFVLASGAVKIFKVSPQGREQIIHQLGPGSTFNDVAVLDGGPNPASAEAMVDSTAWVIARADIRRLAQEHPTLAWALIESIAARARHLVEMVEDLSLRSVKARLAKLLLSEAERAAGQAEIDRGQMMTQTEMAARLGTVREMVGRALRELADDRLIVLDRHRIVIADRDEMSRIAKGW
jgi:CRP/FNR family transcriptional regulator